MSAALSRLEDLEQIRQLFVEYSRVLDKQDSAAYGALLAAGGEFVASPPQGLQQAKGPAAIQGGWRRCPAACSDPSRARTSTSSSTR